MRLLTLTACLFFALRIASGGEAPPAHRLGPSDESERAWHLLRAAEHLEAAGMHDAAKSLRAQAEQARQQLINAKLAEIERLTAEINQLKAKHLAATPRAANQILFQVRVVEISLTKLRALGFDVKAFDLASIPKLASFLTDSDATKESVSIELDPGSGVAGLIKALEQEQIAKVLAEPNVVTVDGRPATYLVGGEIPEPPGGQQAGQSHPRTYGTEIHLVPIKLDDRRVKIELRARVAQLDPKLDRVVDGHTIRGIRSVEVDTGCELQFGETAVIAGLLQQRVSNPAGADEKTEPDEITTVLLVRPELVQVAAPSRTPQQRTAR